MNLHSLWRSFSCLISFNIHQQYDSENLHLNNQIASDAPVYMEIQSRQSSLDGPFAQLPLDVRGNICDFVPDRIFDLIDIGLVNEQEIKSIRFLERQLMDIYLIPELSELPLHRHLVALIRSPFPKTDSGRIEAAQFLLFKLVSSFRRSPIRKHLTLIFFTSILTQNFYRENVKKIAFALSYFSPPKQGRPGTDFPEYTLAVLFEAKQYDLIPPFYSSFFYHQDRKWAHVNEVYWYELPCFGENIAEILQNGNHNLLKLLWSTLKHDHVHVEARFEFVSTLVELEGGLEFVFDMLRLERDTRLLEVIMYIDFGERNREVYHRLLTIYNSPDLIRQHPDVTVCLNAKYLDEIISYELIHAKPDTLALASLLSKSRMEDIYMFLYMLNSRLDYRKVMNSSAFYRFAIQNYHEWFVKHVQFTPKMVDYDLASTLQYHDCKNIKSFVENASKTLNRFNLTKEYFKFVYLHFSVHDFDRFINRIESCRSDILNLNALIEIKGQRRDEFIEYFRIFLRHWKNPKLTARLSLSESNLTELVNIPGALELMFGDGPFSLSVYDFVDFLNHDRAYGLLKRNEHILHQINDILPEFAFNFTTLQRAQEFAVSQKSIAQAIMKATSNNN